MTYALVLHGGAGAQPGSDYTQQKKDMSDLIDKGQAMLEAGTSAVDVVAAIVADMESSGLYVAGKGSAPNTEGQFELDASIMEGHTQNAGAVSGVPNIVSPIHAARFVMRDGRHVMMTSQGAQDFARAHGIEVITDADAYYTEHEGHGSGELATAHGTVGACALDTHGHLAAATSTGGTFHKLPGRVGDTPLIGCGTWADEHVAVSCTGVGEAFIRTCAAHDIAAQVKYAQTDLNAAARATLDKVKTCGGDGGLIAIDRSGRIIMPYNSDGMKRAAVSSHMEKIVRVFEPEP